MLHKTPEFWIDMNLPPVMAIWLTEGFGVKAKTFKELGFDIKGDAEIFRIAKSQPFVVVITTKDIDFVYLSEDIGPLPKVLYLNTGNISNKQLKKIVEESFADVIRIFTETNQSLIEITT
jgi:predicted nuclease of predicted toxin-antitoxin system